MRHLFGLLLSVLLLFANVDYENAKKLAIQNDKLLMTIITTTSCPWCKKMKSEVLSDSNVKVLIEKNFVFVELNKKEVDDFLYARYVPTIYIVNPKNDDLVFEIFGFKTKKEFLELLYDFNNSL